MKIAAVILTAGLSSRMGLFKPLLRLGEKSLLGHCRTLFDDCGLAEVRVVVGHRAEEMAAEAADLGMRWLVNTEYSAGMFSSIRCAVAALPGDVEAFFILPVDIPLIRAATVEAMLAAFAGEHEAILYPFFADRRGHPPLIPASLIPAILDHNGVGGLEALLDRYRGVEIAVWDEGILMDADTPEDFERLQQRLARFSLPNQREVDALAGLLLPGQGLEHGRQVGRAAVALARRLNERGCNLDMDLIYGGALLHDVAKGQPRHEIRGAEMLAALGLAEIAAVVAVHKDLGAPEGGILSEKEIVCLADKLIRGADRISIGERYAEKLQLFADDAAISQEILGRRERALALKELVERKLGKNLETLLAEAGL